MTDTKYWVAWADSSSPFDDSEKGKTYTEVVDQLVELLLDKDKGICWKFNPIMENMLGTHVITVYDRSRNVLIGSLSDFDPNAFKRYLLNTYADVYPDLNEMLSRKFLPDAPRLGFSQKPLSEYKLDTPEGVFLTKLLGETSFADGVIRYIYQKMIYVIAKDESNSCEIINVWIEA